MSPSKLLATRRSLRQLYHADLFDPLLIRTLGLIPSEYLFFYYSQRKAYRNQLNAGASRGEELVRLNTDLFAQLSFGDSAGGAGYLSSLPNATECFLSAFGGRSRNRISSHRERA